MCLCEGAVCVCVKGICVSVSRGYACLFEWDMCVCVKMILSDNPDYPFLVKKKIL